MRRLRVAAGLVAVTALTVGAAACGSSGGSGSGTGGGRTLTIGTDAEVAYLNPPNDNGTTGIHISRAIWAPLIQTNPDTGEQENVVAKSVTSKDAKTWTIELKPGWKFTNGEKLTAKSYVDTWNYTAYGPHAYANNGWFETIEGYEALNPTKGKPKTDKLSGLKVLGPLKFQVTLKYPFSPFPLKLQYLGTAALASEVLKNPKKYDHKPIGYGMYQLDGEWKTGQPIKLKRNPGYPVKKVPNADKIVFRFFSNPETRYNEFQSGSLDYSQVPATKMNVFKRELPGKWAESKNTGNIAYITPYLGAPYDNKKIRQALSLAINRKSLAKLTAGSFPASGFIAPGIEGYREGACQYCRHDVAQARKLLRDAGGFKGTLQIYYGTDNPGSSVFAQALGNMWRQDLKIKVGYVGKPAGEIAKLREQNKMKGVTPFGWGHDYPSIEDYLTPMFATHGDVNINKYSNPEFDRLIEKANGTANEAESTRLYQQAEDILLEELPMIPTFHTRDPYLHADGVEPQNSKYTGINPIWSKITR